MPLKFLSMAAGAHPTAAFAQYLPSPCSGPSFGCGVFPLHLLVGGAVWDWSLEIA